MANSKEAREMDNPLSCVKKEYDVFIIFCDANKTQATHVCDALEKKGLRCLASWKEGVFTPGRPSYENIKKCIDKASRTLLILTKNSLTNDASRGWVSLEVMLAIEKSKLENQMILRLLLIDIDPNDRELEKFRKGLLENIPAISVSFNKDDWGNKLVESLMNEVKAQDLLPVGSLAHGQVFSHFVGFLSIILPVFKEKLKESKIFREHPEKLSKKYYILIPASSKTSSTLDCEEKRLNIKVEKEETLVVKKIVAGKPRTYTLTLYKAQKGEEVYYFFGDSPNVLDVIHTMNGSELANVDIRYQIARFYYTLSAVVHHAENTECRDTVKVIPFNTNYETLADVLFGEAQRDVQDANNQVQVRQTPQQIFSDRSFSQCTHDCALVYYSGGEEDKKVATEIKTFLINNDKTVYETEAGKNILSGLDKTNWVVFVLSKEALEHDDSLIFTCTAVLHDCYMTNRVRVLPILVDVDPKCVPESIKWVTMLKIQEPNYCDKLLQVMNGSDITMEHRLPAGDVITGLAWGYVINYLPVTLHSKPDFRARIKKKLVEERITSPCIFKLHVIVPKTCCANHEPITELNKKYPSDQAPVKYVGALDPVIKTSGGQYERKYYLHMFEYTNPKTKKSTCFITEYSTPIHCLYEMTTRYPFAGLNAESMHRQSSEYATKVDNIVNREAVKLRLWDMSDLVHFLQFDDEHQPLLEAFEEQVKFDDVPPNMLVFGEDIQPQGDPNYQLPSMCNR